MSRAWAKALKQALESGAESPELRDHVPGDLIARSLLDTVNILRDHPAHPMEPGVLVREPDLLVQCLALRAEELVPERPTVLDRPALVALAAGGPCGLVTAVGCAEALVPNTYRALPAGTAFQLEAQGECLILFATGRAREAAPARNVGRLYLLALAGRLGTHDLRAEVEPFLEHEDAETRFVAARSATALRAKDARHGA